MKAPFKAHRVGDVITSPCWDRGAPKNLDDPKSPYNAISIQIPNATLDFNLKPISVIRSLTPKQAMQLSEDLFQAAISLGADNPRTECKSSIRRRRVK